MNHSILVVITIVVACASAEEANGPTNRIPWRSASADVIATGGLPEIGNWMLDSQGRPATGSASRSISAFKLDGPP